MPSYSEHKPAPVHVPRASTSVGMHPVTKQMSPNQRAKTSFATGQGRANLSKAVGSGVSTPLVPQSHANLINKIESPIPSPNIVIDSAMEDQLAIAKALTPGFLDSKQYEDKMASNGGYLPLAETSTPNKRKLGQQVFKTAVRAVIEKRSNAKARQIATSGGLLGNASESARPTTSEGVLSKLSEMIGDIKSMEMDVGDVGPLDLPDDIHQLYNAVRTSCAAVIEFGDPASKEKFMDSIDLLEVRLKIFLANKIPDDDLGVEKLLGYEKEMAAVVRTPLSPPMSSAIRQVSSSASAMGKAQMQAKIATTYAHGIEDFHDVDISQTAMQRVAGEVFQQQQEHPHLAPDKMVIESGKNQGLGAYKTDERRASSVPEEMGGQRLEQTGRFNAVYSGPTRKFSSSPSSKGKQGKRQHKESPNRYPKITVGTTTLAVPRVLETTPFPSPMNVNNMTIGTSMMHHSDAVSSTQKETSSVRPSHRSRAASPMSSFVQNALESGESMLGPQPKHPSSEAYDFDTQSQSDSQHIAAHSDRLLDCWPSPAFPSGDIHDPRSKRGQVSDSSDDGDNPENNFQYISNARRNEMIKKLATGAGMAEDPLTSYSPGMGSRFPNIQTNSSVDPSQRMSGRSRPKLLAQLEDMIQNSLQMKRYLQHSGPSIERLQIFSRAWEELARCFQTYRSIILRIKSEYDGVIVKQGDQIEQLLKAGARLKLLEDQHIRTLQRERQRAKQEARLETQRMREEMIALRLKLAASEKRYAEAASVGLTSSSEASELRAQLQEANEQVERLKEAFMHVRRQLDSFNTTGGSTIDDEIQGLRDRLKQSIPKKDYEDILEKNQALTSLINELQQQMNALRAQMRASRSQGLGTQITRQGLDAQYADLQFVNKESHLQGNSTTSHDLVENQAESNRAGMSAEAIALSMQLNGQTCSETQTDKEEFMRWLGATFGIAATGRGHGPAAQAAAEAQNIASVQYMFPELNFTRAESSNFASTVGAVRSRWPVAKALFAMRSLFPKDKDDSAGRTKEERRKLRAARAKDDYLPGLGSGPDVPPYLQAKGRIKNRYYTKRDTENMIKEVWKAKRKQKNKQHLSSFLLSYMFQKFGEESVVHEVCYSLVYAVERFKWDADCELFLGILRFELPENLKDFQLEMQENIMAALRKTEKRIHGTEAGELMPGDIMKALQSVLQVQGKNDSNWNGVLSSLCAENDGEVINYDTVFDEDSQGNQGPFAECMRDQTLEEYQTLVSQIRRGLIEIGRRPEDMDATIRAATPNSASKGKLGKKLVGPQRLEHWKRKKPVPSSLEAIVTATGEDLAKVWQVLDERVPWSVVQECTCHAFGVETFEACQGTQLPVFKIIERLRHKHFIRYSAMEDDEDIHTLLFPPQPVEDAQDEEGAPSPPADTHSSDSPNHSEIEENPHHLSTTDEKS